MKALQEKEEKKSATEKQKELRHKKKENKKLLERNNDIKENVEGSKLIRVHRMKICLASNFIYDQTVWTLSKSHSRGYYKTACKLFKT